MSPTLTTLPHTLLVGMHLEMSFVANRTKELWQQFMPRRKDIQHTANNYLYSLEVYPEGFFASFNPEATFEKWAAVSVSQIADLPPGMESIAVKGLYAVFTYKGPPSQAAAFYQHIHAVWLPTSGYQLDHRPHFALMGELSKVSTPIARKPSGYP